jgi:hypothetical protein
MKRLTWFTTAAVAALLFIGPSPVGAGGWAMTSLDPFEPPAAGQPITIGFTILQHGQTPVDVPDVGIRLSGQGQKSEFFPAASDGPDRIGHYTATVLFPSQGTFTWVVEQGWFGPQELGQITIEGGAPASGAGSSWAQPAALRFGLPLVVVACIGVIIGHSARGRRRVALR